MSKLFGENERKEFTLEDGVELASMEEMLMAEQTAIEGDIDTLNKSIKIATSMESTVDVIKSAIAAGEVTKSLLNLANESFDAGNFELGIYETKAITVEADDLNATANNLILSQEGVMDDIWDAIKKFFAAIGKAINKAYKAVLAFFGKKEKKLLTDLEVIKALKDIDPFDLKDSKKFYSKLNGYLKIPFLLEFDMTNVVDIAKFGEMVLSFKEVLKNKELFTSTNVNAGVISTKKLADLVGKKLDIFENKSSLTNPVSGAKTIYSQYLYCFSSQLAFVAVTYAKDGVTFPEVHVNTLVAQKKSPLIEDGDTGKISKSVLEMIVNTNLSITKDFKTFDKDFKSLSKGLEKEFEGKVNSGDKTKNKSSITKNIASLSTIGKDVMRASIDNANGMDRLFQYLLLQYKEEVMKKRS